MQLFLLSSFFFFFFTTLPEARFHSNVCVSVPYNLHEHRLSLIRKKVLVTTMRYQTHTHTSLAKTSSYRMHNTPTVSTST